MKQLYCVRIYVHIYIRCTSARSGKGGRVGIKKLIKRKEIQRKVDVSVVGLVRQCPNAFWSEEIRCCKFLWNDNWNGNGKRNWKSMPSVVSMKLYFIILWNTLNVSCYKML